MTMPGQDYASEQDRYNYLKNLQNQGVPMAQDAYDFINSYESRGSAPVATAPAPAPAAPSSAPASQYPDLNVPVGYQYEMQARDLAMQKYVADQQNAIAADSNRIAEQQNQITKEIADLNAQTQKDIANLNASTQKEIAEKDRELQLQLQRGQIQHEEYMQQRDLAQQESQFTRDLALRTLIADRDYEIQNKQLQLNTLAEARQERELQAQLAANPQDFVAYEMYKRLLPTAQGSTVAEQSQNAWDAAQAAANGGDISMLTSGGQNSGPAQSAPNLLNQPYDMTGTGTHSDQTLSNVANSVFNQNGAQWNPNLSGVGAFGAKINSPNQLSRAEAGQMTDSEMGILQSFLKAGVETSPGGPRVSLDPQEWLQQAQNSWIPTISSATAPTEYK